MPQRQENGQVRIIGGRLRGRRLSVVDRPGLRPTGDRVRETLFNWLQMQVVGARCADLFAGSGALGLEALSRGAASVMLIESDRAVHQQLQASLEQLSLSAEPRVVLEHTTALQWLASQSVGGQEGDCSGPGLTQAGGQGVGQVAGQDTGQAQEVGGNDGAGQRLDLVFVDPPFEQAQPIEVLSRLADGVLADTAQVYVESPADADWWLNLPPGYAIHREARFGEVVARLLSFEGVAGCHPGSV